MPDAFTSNRNLIQPEVGGDDGTWGTLLNSGVMAALDLILGATEAVTITSANVDLTTNQWNNCAVKLTGTLTGNRNLSLPFIAGSTTVAVGGLFVVDNQTSGAFNVTVKTVVSGSIGVTVPQGLRTWLYSDGTNVYYADDSKAAILVYAGNPNGNVAGTAAAVNTPPSICWDYTNLALYVCTTSGNAASAVWTNSAATAATLVPPQGRLTPVQGVAVSTGDVTTTNIYYTQCVGAETPIHNGTTFISYSFPELRLALTSAQASNNLYDIFLVYNSGSPVIGTGPAWTSATPGSCSRGTGAGTTQIARDATYGYLVNSNSLNLIYNTGSGNNTIVVASGRGLYLGTIYVDATAGQVTCHRSVGQNRKFGIWNYYNRSTIALQVTDPTASWLYTTASWRASNNAPSSYSGTIANVGSGTTCNGMTLLNGMAEEQAILNQTQFVSLANAQGPNANTGIGINSITSPTGKIGQLLARGATFLNADLEATTCLPPSLGLTAVFSIEKGFSAAGGSTFSGSSNMILTGVWEG